MTTRPADPGVTRALVTGASGLLGGAVLRELRAHGADVVGWSHTVAAAPDGVRFERVELRDLGATRAAVERAAPDLVVHCAALTDVDACERDPDAARTLNAEAAAAVAAGAAAAGARLLHISTDAVYDGDAPGAHEEDEPPRPLNAYAASKLAGERAVLDAHPAALVVRTTMHGWTAQGRRSFSEAILRTLLDGGSPTLFTDVTFSALPVAELARLLRRLAATQVSGPLNVGAADAVTKERFGRMTARAFGLDDGPIRSVRLADLGLPAARPRNCAIAVERMGVLLGGPPPTVADGLRSMAAAAADGSAGRLKGRPGADLRSLLADDAP